MHPAGDPSYIRDRDDEERPDRESGEGRAQPGDVLGIETDGEETHLGDTREDEDERREEAEKDTNDARR